MPPTLLWGPLLPKLRGQLAEFLHEGSLARLSLLSSPTCVGLRYGLLIAPAGLFLALKATSNIHTDSAPTAEEATPGASPDVQRVKQVTEYQPCVHRLRHLASA